MSCSLRYTPLNKASKEIRILQLLPGVFDDNIRCQLSVTSVYGVFEALSYVWGDATKTRRIEVDGTTKHVTQNLESALRYLRHRDEVRTLWVDAVCIDQGNLQERGHQVGMMDLIYQGAERVIVWLGADNDYNAVPAIKEFGKNQKLHWDRKKRSSTDTDVDPEPLHLFMFLRNPWFKRIWTLQEAVLAKSITYVYKKSFIPQCEMEGFLKSFSRHIVMEKCCSFDEIMGFGLGHGLAPTMSLIMNHIDDLVNLGKGDQRLGFLEVASRTRHRQATDPRDKVFGLLGLVKELPREVIDYEKSVSTTYSRTAFEHIKATAHLGILSHVLFEESPASVNILPSWVPDWSESRYEGSRDDNMRLLGASVRQSYNKFFKACQDSRAHPSCSDRFERLYLEGYFCDKIVQVGKAHTSGSPSSIQDLRKILNVDRDPERAYIAGSTILDAYWRTLCFSVSPYSNYKSGEVQEISEGTRQLHDDWWWEFLKALVFHMPNTFESGDVQRFTDHVNYIADGRRLVVSERGYIGLASANAQIGDEIWLLHGGMVPHILRPSSKQSQSSLVQEYTFIGDSYIHGIMKGEYWEEVTGKEVEPTRLILL